MSITLVLAYLAVMVVSGALPEQHQFVAFEAKGVLKTPPEQIRRVELIRADHRVSLLRHAEYSWTKADGIEIDAELAKRITTAVRMMHNSGPARQIPVDDIADADPAAFGLDASRMTARFFATADDPILTVYFGSRNPDEFLQYVRVEHDDRLYLMSRFVGEAWAGALDDSLRR